MMSTIRFRYEDSVEIIGGFYQGLKGKIDREYVSKVNDSPFEYKVLVKRFNKEDLITSYIKVNNLRLERDGQV